MEKSLLNYDFPSTTLPLVDFASVTPRTPLSSLNLNWKERDLPERLRTKHVHRLHPYLGKFIPQIVEIFLRKYTPKVVCDPFCGSGTTLVEANALGIHSIGCDISAFNCLLSKVKTDKYNILKLEKEIQDILSRIRIGLNSPLFMNTLEDTENEYLCTWFAPKARQQLLYYWSLIPNYEYKDLFQVILSRAARSARLTTHFDLDFPKKPQKSSYYCYKHRRTCYPTDDALGFLVRYSLDALNRIKEFSKIRTNAEVKIICGDAREVGLGRFDMIITSPPYVGLIDYHQQHKYAYELLGLKNNETKEIGAAYKGSSKKAQEEYTNGIRSVLLNVRKYLAKRGVVVIVVNDKYNLYDKLVPETGFRLEDKLLRHVNRRTGRRADDFFEEILVWEKVE
jgi:site-specific DNA-adenine methylase